MRLKQTAVDTFTPANTICTMKSGDSTSFPFSFRLPHPRQSAASLRHDILPALSHGWRRFFTAVCLGIISPSLWAQTSPTPPATEGTAAPAQNNAAPSTRKMADRLEQLAHTSDPRANLFLNRQRAELYRAEILTAPNEMQALISRARMTFELLSAGETQTAINEYEAMGNRLQELHAPPRAAFPMELRLNTAVAYLRLGEQENCLNNHSPLSCILPILPGGVHQLQRGSRHAITLLEDGLQLAPDNLKMKWLLNIAYMTLGEYPDGVPAAWRISPDVIISDYEMKRFPDIAGNLGVDTNDLAGGTITEDFDGDGYLDIMTSDWSLRGKMHLYDNNGDGSFTDIVNAAGLTGIVGGLNLIPGDYNNDGLPDVLVLRGAWLGTAGRLPDSLLRNDGHNHFSDVTEEAGLLAFHPNQTAVWFDFNGDGLLDIYFGYESTAKDPHPCKLYRNNGNGTFTECAAEAGVAALGFVKAAVSGDFNNDGRPDLYLSCHRQPNLLFRNDGPQDKNGGPASPWKFTEVAAQAGVTEPILSFPAWFFDYDNDGWDDIFVSGYGDLDSDAVAADYLHLPNKGVRARLYHNNRDGTFKDVTQSAHLDHVLMTMGSNFGDFDNDGWLDLYLGTGDPFLATLYPNRAFRNADGVSFQDVTTSSGLGHLQKGHAVSFADLDHDGDQDIYASIGGADEGDVFRNALFENPGFGNHWLTLKLEGQKSNRVAIGARIKVFVQNQDGERVICRTVGTGGSFGANPLRQEIGLGQAQAINRVEIFWPVTGLTQTITGLQLDKFYHLREGDPSATLGPEKALKFFVPEHAGPHHHH